MRDSVKGFCACIHWKSGDLVGVIDPWQTTEYSATQLVQSIKFKLSHATKTEKLCANSACPEESCIGNCCVPRYQARLGLCSPRLPKGNLSGRDHLVHAQDQANNHYLDQDHHHAHQVERGSGVTNFPTSDRSLFGQRRPPPVTRPHHKYSVHLVQHHNPTTP